MPQDIQPPLLDNPSAIHGSLPPQPNPFLPIGKAVAASDRVTNQVAVPRIVEAVKKNPNFKFVVIAGDGHTNNKLEVDFLRSDLDEELAAAVRRTCCICAYGSRPGGTIQRARHHPARPAGYALESGAEWIGRAGNYLHHAAR